MAETNETRSFADTAREMGMSGEYDPASDPADASDVRLNAVMQDAAARDLYREDAEKIYDTVLATDDEEDREKTVAELAEEIRQVVEDNMENVMHCLDVLDYWDSSAAVQKTMYDLRAARAAWERDGDALSLAFYSGMEKAANDMLAFFNARAEACELRDGASAPRPYMVTWPDGGFWHANVAYARSEEEAVMHYAAKPHVAPEDVLVHAATMEEVEAAERRHMPVVRL